MWRLNIYLSEMLNFAKEQRSDLVVCGYSSFNDASSPWSMPFYDGNLLSKDDFISLIFGAKEFNKNGKGGMVWKFLSAAPIVKGLRFESDRSILEDEPYCFKLVKRASRISYLGKSLYFYRSVSGSLSKAKDFGSKIIKARFICLEEAKGLSPYIQSLTLSKFANVLIRELKKGGVLPESIRLSDYEQEMKRAAKAGVVSKGQLVVYELFLHFPRAAKAYAALWRMTRPFSHGKWRSRLGIHKKH